MTDDQNTDASPSDVLTMTDASGQGRAALVREETEFTERDVALLRAIDETGSVATASTDLGRSRARDLSRIDELESAFGDLVTRHRGGRDGGGSTLTDTATRLVDQYERLQAALSATAQVPETVLEGTVSSVTGELATVTTSVGTVCGLHRDVARDDPVQVRTHPKSVALISGYNPTGVSNSIASRGTTARPRLMLLLAHWPSVISRSGKES